MLGRAAGLAALLVAPVAADVDSIQHREAFPNELLDAHIALIAVPLCLTALAICAAAVVACARTLRVTVVLVLGVWLALVCIGVVSWSVTYVASRDAILEHAEHSLSLTATQAISSVTAELGAGVDMMQLLQLLAVSEQVHLEAAWPAPHIYFDRMMRTVGRKASSISLLYWGTQQGRFQGLEMGVASGGGVVTDMHYTLPLYGDTIPQWALCTAADWGANCSQIATSSACANSSSEAAVHCAKSCGFPQNATSNCVGRLSLVPTNLANGLNTSRARHSIFEQPAADRQQPVTLEYDPRIRPWYTRNEAPMWSPPYVFGTGEIGITVSAGVITSYSGDFLGSVAVDFRLDTLNRFMSDVKPSDNGVAFLMTSDGLLLGSSMTDVELAQDTGVMKYKEVNDINIMNYNKTESESKIVRAVGAVRSKWGAVEAAAVGSSMYQYSDDVVVSYPIKLQGLTMLLVVSVPMSDIMGKADRASTLSLVMTVSISVGLALLAAVGLKVALLPLEKLRQDMYDVACMNVEGHEDGVSSHLTEIRSMQESFSTMVKNLIEYKQYLPQSVLKESESEHEDTTCIRSQRAATTLVSQGSSSKPPSSTSRIMMSDLGDQFSSCARMRPVSILVTNMKSFVSLAKTRPPRQVTATHAMYLEKVMTCVNGHRGIIDEFMGDKVHASFNTIYSSSIHRAHVVECMTSLTASPIGESMHVDINCAAVTMRALCGNFGCKGLKKYTVVGSAGTFVWTLERWGSAWSIPCVVDASIAQDTQVSFALRKLAKVPLMPRREAFIYELVGAKQNGPQEWMYLVESHKPEPLMLFNDAMSLLYDGKYDEALRKLSEGDGDSATKEIATLTEWVGQCKRRGSVPQPLPAAYIPRKTAEFSDADYLHLAKSDSA